MAHTSSDDGRALLFKDLEPELDQPGKTSFGGTSPSEAPVMTTPVTEVPQSLPSVMDVTFSEDELARYAAFFKDIDAHTEYWPYYMPDLEGRYYLVVGSVLFPGPVKRWRELAVAEGTPGEAAARNALDIQLARPQVQEGLLEIDGLMRDLILAHFPSDAGSGGIDSDSYIRATEAFARDLLPQDPERLARVTANPGSGLEQYALYHRMDGAGLWFQWAATADVTIMAHGIEPHRVLQLAAAAFGSAMDYIFRDDRVGIRTRAAYRRDSATEDLLRTQVAALLQDATAARREAVELYRVFTGLPERPAGP